MNIKQAKEEIIRTINAYRMKDETGAYVIPTAAQRPILLIGPPGIGKTAIMEQIAEECGIGLAAYTITHHTRQSAIGLPMISHKEYGGEDHAVTEYTMSEIVASVYDMQEKAGISEGILFLDEINCVSETLAPTMLQFLQYKKFGTHKVPEGWIIVTAGNQPQYNRSAREFDIVTLDRVKKMDIEADLDVWKEYASSRGIHGAILSYLSIKKQNFYVIRTEVDGRHFATARGWEDLSKMLFAYEAMGEPVTEMMTVQYIQDAETAHDFTVYYELYRKYRDIYRIEDILSGTYLPEPAELKDIPFDEKLSLIRLLSDSLHASFRAYNELTAVQESLYGELLGVKDRLSDNHSAAVFRDVSDGMRRDLAVRKDAGMIGSASEHTARLAITAWDELCSVISDAEDNDAFRTARSWFSRREDKRQEIGDAADRRLANAFSFIDHIYGTGQETVLFLAELNADLSCLSFVRTHGSYSYKKYSSLLLLSERHDALKRELTGF